MFKGIFTFIFAMSFSWPTSTLAAIPKNISTQVSLKKYLNILEDVAAGGPSLGYFSLLDGDRVEVLDKGDKAKCTPISKATIVRDFKNATKTVLSAGDRAAVTLSKAEFEKLQDKAVKEFEKTLGKDKYAFCQKTIASKRSITVINQYRSKRYVFQWELGWED
ncbi:MAG: hypothetical protein A4S09_08260 [Proteobacteria bacterium SG_bin7]|nr:MAG: hypothetical protein A4S09_08260 [Proteobacteria bacterium SG_bin7]